MATIEAILKFLASYPLWAKLLALGGLFVTTTTLVFAPRDIGLTVRSAGSQIRINVLFANLSANYVDIDWLNFDGKKDPEHHQTLAPGESQEVPTYVAHAWLVSNANNGTPIRTIIIKKNTPRVDIY